MNKKFGNKYYTLLTDSYIEKKGLFKTKVVNYENIKKIYINVPMYDNKKKNINSKYDYSFKIIYNDCKKLYFSIYTKRFEFTEILDFFSTLNIIIQTIYHDETKPNSAD